MLPSDWPDLAHWRACQWCICVSTAAKHHGFNDVFVSSFHHELCYEPVSGHSSELTNYLDVKAASFQSMPRLLFVQSSQTRKQLSVMSYKRQWGHVSKDWMIG